MKIPVLFNGHLREASIEYATKPAFGFLRNWRTCLNHDKHPIRSDAVDLAVLACKRFTVHRSFECYAQCEQDFDDYIRNNPKCEVAGLILMQCNWYPESKVIGVAHFRRSWCNNLILDYLAAHPWIARKPADYPNDVRGVGTALLFYLSQLGAKYHCGAIWGEATQNSSETYQRFFDLEKVQDLLYIPNEKFVNFAQAIKKKWA